MNCDDDSQYEDWQGERIATLERERDELAKKFVGMKSYADCLELQRDKVRALRAQLDEHARERHRHVNAADVVKRLDDILGNASSAITCGGEPADADNAELLRFREYLSDIRERGVFAVHGDPKWAEFLGLEAETWK